jgi:hypothetical protein
VIVPPAVKSKALNEVQRVALIAIFPVLFPPKRFIVAVVFSLQE